MHDYINQDDITAMDQVDRHSGKHFRQTKPGNRHAWDIYLSGGTLFAEKVSRVGCPADLRLDDTPVLAGGA